MKSPKIVVMSPTVTSKNSKHKEVIWQQYRLCLTVAEYQILGGKHFLILGPEAGKIWWLKKRYNSFRKITTSNGPCCVARNPSGFFINLAISYNYLSSYQLCVSMWFPRNASPNSSWTLKIQDKSDSTRAPQHRQICADQ